jgi:hypothetical protein
MNDMTIQGEYFIVLTVVTAPGSYTKTPSSGYCKFPEFLML